MPQVSPSLGSFQIFYKKKNIDKWRKMYYEQLRAKTNPYKNMKFNASLEHSIRGVKKGLENGFQEASRPPWSWNEKCKFSLSAVCLNP